LLLKCKKKALQKGEVMDFVQAMQKADEIFEEYKRSHPMWWKLLDGTPIINDLSVKFAEKIRDIVAAEVNKAITETTAKVTHSLTSIAATSICDVDVEHSADCVWHGEAVKDASTPCDCDCAERWKEANRVYRLEQIAHLIGSIFYHSNFFIESHNEAMLDELLKQAGARYTNENQIIEGNEKLAIDRTIQYEWHGVRKTMAERLSNKK
jgi:hypothetical protein